MNLIDVEYTKTPQYGTRKILEILKRKGHNVNHKRVARLMNKMGLYAICPGPKTSKKKEASYIYPYLLRGLKIDRPNQVWCADITYIRMLQGFLYLVAIMDWYSRYVISWALSNTLDTTFCLEALDEALEKGSSEIFNSDQGVQFTSESFTGRLKEAGIRISMDGRGRVFDNIFIERLWRTVKYEEVYIKDYIDAKEAHRELEKFFKFYNSERIHQSLGYKTPEEVYMGK